MTTDIIVGIAIGVTITYGAYLNWRMARLEEVVGSFPDVEELAREVLRVKISASELPDEVKAAFSTFAAQSGTGIPPTGTGRPDYMG